MSAYLTTGPVHFFSALILLWGVTSCAISPGVKDRAADEKLVALLDGVSTSSPETSILYLPGNIRAELDEQVDEKWNDIRKLRKLRGFLFNEEGRHITYSANKTKTASETYLSGQGNCLSLTNLFVASARYIGLKARFKTVSVKPTWDQQGTIMIRYEHIVAVGKLRNGDDYVIDFLPEFSIGNRQAEVISDVEALSLYYSNLGAEHLVAGSFEQAIVEILKALSLRPEFSDAWNNLGAAYRRNGSLELAELSYERALRLDRNNYSALANLTQFYLSQGRPLDAEKFLVRVNRYYRRNPYFHFYLAQLSFQEGKYGETIGYLEQAIRLKRDDPEFYDALALAYEVVGSQAQSERVKKRAAKVRAKLRKRRDAPTERTRWRPAVQVVR